MRENARIWDGSGHAGGHRVRHKAQVPDTTTGTPDAAVLPVPHAPRTCPAQSSPDTTSGNQPVCACSSHAIPERSAAERTQQLVGQGWLPARKLRPTCRRSFRPCGARRGSASCRRPTPKTTDHETRDTHLLRLSSSPLMSDGVRPTRLGSAGPPHSERCPSPQPPEPATQAGPRARWTRPGRRARRFPCSGGHRPR